MISPPQKIARLARGERSMFAVGVLVCVTFFGIAGLLFVSRDRANRYAAETESAAVTAALIGLGYAASSSVWLGYLAAALAVFVAYVRAMAKAAGAPNDFRGPMAKQQRMAIVTFACLYVALAPASWQPALPPFHDAASPGAFTIALVLIIVGSAITSVRRLRGIANGLIARSIAASDGGELRPPNGLH